MRDVCVLHGPLLPCLPDISIPPSKNKTKFSVPSFIEIKESTIPGAGQGAFTKQFIEPGRILGKLLSKNGRTNYYYECICKLVRYVHAPS